MAYTVYKHTNKINGKVYIGITSQNVKRRWQNGAGYYGTYFYNAIKKYGWNLFTHEILYENLTQEAACKCEKELIKEYKSDCREFGYNVAEGGQIIHGVHDRVGVLNHKSEAVLCYDSSGNFLRRYESQNMAAKDLGINRKGITKCCMGISKTYKGYVFEYADKEYDKPKRPERGKHKNHKTVSVLLVSENGEIIETFESALVAAEKFGCKANGIVKCCNGYLNTYKGRRWCHAV